MDDLATAISAVRKLRSQEEFAKKIGVTRQTVIQWELGKSTPSLKQARELVNEGVPVELFLAKRRPSTTIEAADQGTEDAA